MGCDIHLYVEKKIKGNWISISPLKYESYNDDYSKRVLSDIFTGRNYNLFGWLAQVRTDQESGFEAKGFPNDASKEVEDIFKEWGGDAHTPSYLTFGELDSKFKNTIIVSGVMHQDQKSKLDKSIANDEADWNLLYPNCQMTTQENHTQFKYEVPINFIFEHFNDEVMDFMSDYTYDKEKEEHDVESVRIVFWFDN